LTEAEWQKRGLAITALASDSVSGVLAEQRGIHPIYATLDEGFKMLRGRQFDCVVLRHLIHLFPDPARLIAACSSLLRPGGVLLLSAPNFNRFEVLFRRMRFKAQYREMSSFAKSSINLSGPRALSKILKQAGFRAIEFHWVNHRALLRNWPQPPRRLGCLTAADWMMAATRGAASDPVTTPLKALEGKRL
jgi:2-polyprenyl-3-methyl-5-hydroxy-6-metoxy-1,4-benzoquinol methylase